jgi:hypothetical protein
MTAKKKKSTRTKKPVRHVIMADQLIEAVEETEVGFFDESIDDRIAALDALYEYINKRLDALVSRFNSIDDDEYGA